MNIKLITKSKIKTKVQFKSNTRSQTAFPSYDTKLAAIYDEYNIENRSSKKISKTISKFVGHIIFERHNFHKKHNTEYFSGLVT